VKNLKKFDMTLDQLKNQGGGFALTPKQKGSSLMQTTKLVPSAELMTSFIPEVPHPSLIPAAKLSR